MNSWVILTIGAAVIGVLVFIARQWGRASIKKAVLKKKVDAAITRKAIDAKVQKLTPDELRDRLRGGM